MNLRRFLGVLVSSALACSLPAADPAPLVPVESFFGTDAILQMALSPDGNKIAMLAPNNGRYSIAMLDTTNGALSVIVHFADENIRHVFWKGNDRLLFHSYVEGHEVPLLASTDLLGKRVKRILEPRVRPDDFSIFFGRLVDWFPASDDHILIMGFTSEHDPRSILPSMPVNPNATIYKVNVETARRGSVVVLDDNMDDGYFDGAAQQRLTTVARGREIDVMIRARNDDRWRTLRTFDVNGFEWDIHDILADGRTLVLTDVGENDRGELRTLDLDTGELSPVLFTPPAGEITRLIYAPRRARLLGVEYEDTRTRSHWFDPKWKGIAAALERSFPDHVVSITSIADDEKRFLFEIESDRDPGRYFLGDLRGDGLRVQPINARRGAINPALMSPMEPIQFTARDGMEIHGYLTKPGGKVDARTPLLVMPHGGPFGIRDSWEFQPDVQFLASRGYAVLQVNYRGSGGYGSGFMQAGYREWGGKMQDDLTDAVKWVLAQGWGDPERVGIIGASYGGYAALAGVTLTPQLYRVGINYVGVSDLRLITRWDMGQTSTSRAVIENRIGKDSEFLAQRSPVNHVAAIRVPTLHAYGYNDPRVDFANWQVLEAALKKHGKTYESIVEGREGHGFEKAESSIKFYTAVEKFLARYMPSDRLAGTPAARSN